MKNFDTFGVMIDCSRNAVMKPSALKEFFVILAKMGYNQVQLYTEDTYEVDGEEFFGYFRGRYTQEELKDLDDYAAGLGIELVPCIQTLAHLNAAVRWDKYRAMTDCADILLVGDDRTYELIDHMFSSLRKCFRTDKIHIGMDEAHALGTGRYRDLHGDVDRKEILLYHLNRVCELADKYQFVPMMWSDMFYRIAYGDYYMTAAKFDPSIKEKIPEKLSLVYWDYYHSQKKVYDNMIKGHKQLCDRVVFAGGVWKWSGFTPHNEFALRVTKAAFSACVAGGVRDAFITMWGDDGAEASPYSVLPSLFYAACIAEGITKKEEIAARFKELFGVSFDDFMLLDLPDKLMKTRGIINPSKYLLHNDCFMGIMDSAVRPDDTKKYASFARRLSNAAKRAGEFAYLFDTAAKLCKTLSIKADIGVRARTAYQAGDKEALAVILKDFAKMIKYMEAFYEAFRYQWHKENKAHGFDVQDIRLGGVIFRMKTCQKRLKEYLDGTIDRIEELDEKLLVLPPEHTCYNSWRLVATSNVV